MPVVLVVWAFRVEMVPVAGLGGVFRAAAVLGGLLGAAAALSWVLGAAAALDRVLGSAAVLGGRHGAAAPVFEGPATQNIPSCGLLIC